MKKVVCLLITLALIFGFSACKNDTGDGKNDENYQLIGDTVTFDDDG